MLALTFLAPIGYALQLSLFQEQAFFGGTTFVGFALVAALAIDSARLHAAGFFRIVIFLPYAVPAVVAAFMWAYMYGTNFGLAADFNDLFGTEIRPLSLTWALPAIGNIVTWESVHVECLGGTLRPLSASGSGSSTACTFRARRD